MESRQVKDFYFSFLFFHCRHVPWSHHEPQRHKFYFTGDLDLRYVLMLKLPVSVAQR